MKTVRVAALKARLSEYLRAVRRGETVAVLEGETPVAYIVPVRRHATLQVRRPGPGTPRLSHVPLPKPVPLDVDVVELLLEEHQEYR